MKKKPVGNKKAPVAKKASPKKSVPRIPVAPGPPKIHYAPDSRFPQVPKKGSKKAPKPQRTREGYPIHLGMVMKPPTIQ